MRRALSFEGEIGRLPYAVAATTLFLSQHLAVIALFAVRHETLVRGWRFFLLPLRSIADLNHAPPFVFALAIVFSFLIAWGLEILSFRRAANAGQSGWIAATAFVPAFQIIVIAYLSAIPPHGTSTTARIEGSRQPLDWRIAVQGMLGGAGVTLFTVVVGALIFGAYGYGMFVVGPLMIGAVTAYVANRKNDIGEARTFGLVVCAAGLGAIALIAVALEGAICIILASPLVAGMALLGGLLGRKVALSRYAKPRHTAMSVAILPMVFLAEHVLPPSATFEASHSVEVAAPADKVWQSLIHMDAIAERPSLPFRLGVAYPIGGTILGSGVGAKRLGEFSTGVAVERVTQWDAGKVLAFEVLRDPPAMREMSPYRHVNAPHVVGYFHTTTTTFTLTPLASGGTRVTLRTDHELKLDPVLYWLPLARWVVDQDDARVLRYLSSHSG